MPKIIFGSQFLITVACVIVATGLIRNSTAAATKTSRASSNVVPIPAARVGYKNETYAGQFTQRSIDLNNTAASGFDWYPYRFYGTPTPSAERFVLNSDGSATLGNESLDASLASAVPTKTPLRWAGIAFGGGGYFEATLRFDPGRTIRANGKAWPSFWALPIEHVFNLPQVQWAGQPPEYVHFVELDFFEYDIWTSKPKNDYDGAIHEWYGIYKASCPGHNFCQASNGGHGINGPTNIIATPMATDFRKDHKFGFLWVPATKTSPGYAQYYFDGVATTDKVTWNLYEGQPPPPGVVPWTFGVMDSEHFALIVGTGIDQPVTVSSVRVWQSSTANNIRQ